MPVQAEELFSAQEREWIRLNPIVRVGVSPDWRPIEYVEGGKFKGLGAEYLRALRRISGLKFETHIMDWASGRQALSSKQIDLLPTYAKPLGNQELPGAIIASEPYFITGSIIVSKADVPIIFDARKLIGKVVAIKGGGAYERQLRALYPGINLMPVGTVEEALDQVVTGDAYAAVGVDAVLIPMMHQRYLDSLHVAGVITGMPAILRMGVHPDNTVLLSIINKSLASITASESDRLAENWIRTTTYGQPSWGVVLRFYFWELTCAFTLVLIFGALVYHAWVARRKAERSERDKAMFLAVMSHEIRTPMNVILSSVELLGRANLAPKEASLVRVAVSGATNLLSLLNDVLDFSKMEAGKITLESSPIDTCALARDTLSSFELRAEEKGLQLELMLKGQNGLWPVVDPTRLRQILANLLSNAIKFTEVGKVMLTVELRPNAISSGKGELVFEVRDTGIGISPKQQARLFNAFAQGDESTTRKYGGTGLGLRICADLAYLMGSKINVVSEPGKGSTFSLRIPVLLEVPEQIPETLQLTPIAETRASALQILVVEDHPSNRFVIECQLVELGHCPTLIEHGLEALDLVTQRHFDLILLDCNLLDVDGYELVGMLRNLEVLDDAYIPIIAISATVGPEHVSRCFESGFDGVLSKPLRLEELCETISQWCATVSDEPSVTSQSDWASVQQNVQEQMLESIREDLAHVMQAVESGELEVVRRGAHRIVGAALYTGWSDVAEQARLLEQSSESVSPERLAAILRELDARVAERTSACLR